MPGLDVSAGVLANALLETIVPRSPDLNLENAVRCALENGADDLSDVLSLIPQRQLLFFDEYCSPRIVLRLSNCPEASLKCHLQHLEVQLDVFAVDPAEQIAEGTAPTKDLILSEAVGKDQDPLVIVNEFEGETESGNHVYVIWTIRSFLRRPKIRIQHPSLVFLASARLSPTEGRRQKSREDSYLPPLIPASMNILQPLSSDKSLDHKDLFLPASRLLKVVPATFNADPIYNVHQQTSRPIRVIAAASARIRYSRLATYSSRPTTVASLDFEVTPLLDCDVIFDKAELRLWGGTVESLPGTPDLLPPITCSPRDDVTLVYKLTSEQELEPNPSTTVSPSALDISLEAVVLLSEDCRPRISMRWGTNVDFSLPLNLAFGGPSHSIQRNNRPASLPMTPARSDTNVSMRQQSTSSIRERLYAAMDVAVTISFSGPANVEVGKPFFWNVFIVNRSAIPRKFALVAIPRRKRPNPRGHVARPSSSSIASRKQDLVAEAVTDDNIVHAMQKNATCQDAELLCLSSDIRVGPLLPATCHSADLKLLPLSVGPLRLESIRLVDINTNETTDIRDLPDVVAFDRKSTSYLQSNQLDIN